MAKCRGNDERAADTMKIHGFTKGKRREIEGKLTSDLLPLSPEELYSNIDAEIVSETKEVEFAR